MSTPENLDVVHYRWSDDDNASHEATTLLGSEDASYEIPLAQLGTGYNLITKIYNDGEMNAVGEAFQLQYNKDGAGWNDVDQTSSNVRSFPGQDTNNATSSTERLTAAGTFETSRFDTDGLSGAQTVNSGTSIEIYWCVEFRSADNSGGETYDFQVTYDGTPGIVCTNDVVPEASIQAGGPEPLAAWNVDSVNIVRSKHM